MSEPLEPRVDGLTIGEVLERQAHEIPEREALVFFTHGDRATYADYLERVDEAARGLLALGIERGHHVAVWSTNWPQWTILQLATARIGAVLVTVNPAYRVHELAYTLEQADVRALFLIDRFKSSDYHRLLIEACPEIEAADPGEIGTESFPELRWIVSLADRPVGGMISWGEMLERGRDVPAEAVVSRQARLRPDDPINLQYTSGTTGFPKGAMLSHRNLLLNARAIGRNMGLSPEDRICVPVPFYHCFGCVIGTMCSLVYGATMLVPGEYFDPEITLDCVEAERATALYGVPTMFIAELEHESFSGRDLSSLRTGVMAGSPCPEAVMTRVMEEMGADQITIAYGLTEASPVVTQTRVDDALDLRVRTVGRPLPGVEVRIVDEAGNDLPDGEPGELIVKGPNVMLGYYDMPEETAGTIEDGWLHTGDLAIREPNGYFRITGRIKDMIIRGGENVYPREIEEFLYTHPGVEEVAVVGVPDPKYGEEICAWIRPKRGRAVTADEIVDFCKGQLAHYKIPRYVEFVEVFPQTVTGKIRKFKLREMAEERLGVAEAG